MPGVKRAKPKHQQLFESLSKDILGGRYAPGEKFPSEAALVNRFHVSRITAGRAVHDLQEQGLVERFAGSGTYVSRSVERSKNGLLFGLIIPDLGGTEIFEPICRGIAGAPDAAGHALLWPHAAGPVSDKEQQALQLCEQCVERRVSGVFFAPLEMTPRSIEVNRRVIAALKRAEIPVVLLDRMPGEANPRERCDLVSIDNLRAGYLATDHLLKCGARNVGFLAYRGQASTIAARISGYRQALQEHHPPLQPGHVLQVEAQHRFELPERAAQCDGLVCSNDHLAGLAMHALLAQGLRIPQDVRIVGFDDVNYAALLPVPLTTIHQPCSEIGRTALRLLLERIAHPRMPARAILLDCDLVVRQSCGFQVTG
jgi:GntR family transcriptional regulator of arabinose operon